MRGRRMLTAFVAGILLAGQIGVPVLAKSSSELQEELDQYEEELSASEEKSEELTEQIASMQKEVGDLTSQMEALNIEMAAYRESMSVRIKYFYEESMGNSVLDILFGADSFSDFLSRLDYLQSMYSYDAEQLDAYNALIKESDEKEAQYQAQIEEMSALLDEQEALQASLTESISGTESAYADAKEAEEAAAKEAAEKASAEKEAAEKEAAEKAAEEKAKAEQEAEAAKKQEEKELAEAAKAMVDEAKSSSGSSKSSSSGSGSTKSDGSVAVVSKYAQDSGGVLTKSKGVVYYNGHKETWYSTKEGSAGVVNGIPGRNVGSDGIIRDGDGYICVASSDLPKGTLIETSLGMGKVYDTGCASGTIDIYTTW